jgi:UDP-N-acetylmuramyl pentapeptide phosphotransferase/UDP-N-acetylglucosamine-1-phosphate transferase
VITVLAGYTFATGSTANLSYVAAATSIAIVSFIDDLFSIPLIPRLLVHFAAAAFLVYCSGGFHGINAPFSGKSIEFGFAGPAITVLFIVWVTNAFNFMDGIDGIAGAQGLGSGLGWTLYGLSVGDQTLSTVGGIITGACLGFLLFNWQPARVFMGDVGSTFLGFTLASMPLVTLSPEKLKLSNGLLMAMAFLWLFLFDATYTRLLQVLRLRPFWRPHREHLYQQIVVGGTSHRRTAAFFGIFSILTAISINILGGVPGQAAAAALLVAGPILLLLFAWKKRLT